MNLLDEFWTEEEISNARLAMSSVYEGVSCSLTFEEMQHLASRGLVKDLKRLSGRGRYAGRYEFMWEDKLQNLISDFRANTDSPTAHNQTTAQTATVSPVGGGE